MLAASFRHGITTDTRGRVLARPRFGQGAGCGFRHAHGNPSAGAEDRRGHANEPLFGNNPPPPCVSASSTTAYFRTRLVALSAGTAGSPRSSQPPAMPSHTSPADSGPATMIRPSTASRWWESRPADPSTPPTAGDESMKPWHLAPGSCGTWFAIAIHTTQCTCAPSPTSRCPPSGSLSQVVGFRSASIGSRCGRVTTGASISGAFRGALGHAVQRLCVRLTPEAYVFSELHSRRLREEGLRVDPVAPAGALRGRPSSRDRARGSRPDRRLRRQAHPREARADDPAGDQAGPRPDPAGARARSRRRPGTGGAATGHRAPRVARTWSTRPASSTRARCAVPSSERPACCSRPHARGTASSWWRPRLAGRPTRRRAGTGQRGSRARRGRGQRARRAGGRRRPPLPRRSST